MFPDFQNFGIEIMFKNKISTKTTPDCHSNGLSELSELMDTRLANLKTDRIIIIYQP